MPSTENIAALPATYKVGVTADAVIVRDEGDLAEAIVGVLQEWHPERQQWLDAGFEWLLP